VEEAATGLSVCCECGQGDYAQQDRTTSGAKSVLKQYFEKFNFENLWDIVATFLFNGWP